MAKSILKIKEALFVVQNIKGDDGLKLIEFADFLIGKGTSIYASQEVRKFLISALSKQVESYLYDIGNFVVAEATSQLIVCDLLPPTTFGISEKAGEVSITNDQTKILTVIRTGILKVKTKAIITKPSQYTTIMEEINSMGGISLSTRKKLAMVAINKIVMYEVDFTNELRSWVTSAE